MGWDEAEKFINLMIGPVGALVVLIAVAGLLVGFLYFQHKANIAHRKEVREDATKLHDTHAATVRELTAAFERTNERVVQAAETAEKLCEARYAALLQELIRNKA